MSRDGGSQAEFEEYWTWNAVPHPLASGWVERRAHPQVNTEPFWYHEATSATAWQRPLGAEELKGQAATRRSSGGGMPELTGEGPEWKMGIEDLKAALAAGRSESLGLQIAELARRAVAEYEQFQPRVLSWHDYQHITFWFFGGLKRRQRSPGTKSFFEGRSGAGRELFADDAFFQAAAELIRERLGQMHPINLTYFVWTFTRAGVVLPELMESVGNHLCEGLLPTLDRCSLGTMVWNFTKQGVRHDRLFAAAARELCRPNRTRSLAARNFQNVMIAYSRRDYWDEELYDALATGIPRLLDTHDPRQAKCERSLLFSYTCKDGFEVLADSFRINNLTVILRCFLRVPVKGPAMERCVASMADYVRRSGECSPRMMREPSDLEEFVLALAGAAADGRWGAGRLLAPGGPFDVPSLLEGMPARKADQLRRLLRRAGPASQL